MNLNINRFQADQITLCIHILLKILKKVVPTDTRRLSLFRRSTSDDSPTIKTVEQQHESIQQTQETSDDVFAIQSLLLN